jgi:hypothetical protein
MTMTGTRTSRLFVGAALAACLSSGSAAAPVQNADKPPAVPPAFTYRASVYFDWYGAAYSQGGGFLNQIGTRVKFELVKGPSRNWTVLVDVRERKNMVGGGSNQLIIYNARLTFDGPSSPLYASVGRMNLYDTAGIGQLLGAVAGWRLKRTLLLGGYAGLEQQAYAGKFDGRHLKYGAFARFTGPRALTFSLSLNEIRYAGTTERRYVYAQGLFPVRRLLYVFGNAEYELGPGVRREDRLSRLFLNARLDLSRRGDVTAFYSSGRGLDLHGYVLENADNPAAPNRDLERFFYSEQYGARVSVKPLKNVRLFVSRQESRQKDLNILNHTWRVGASVSDILKSGVTAFGDYSFNRGTRAESNSYYIALDKDFGRFSCNLSFSDTYNGLRFDSVGGEPQVIHLAGYKTLSAYVSVPVSRRLSFAVDYSRFLMNGAGEHQFFVRIIFRK